MAFGIAGLTQALSGVDFPASKQQILDEEGNRKFEVEKGKRMTVKDALQDCQIEQFGSMAEVVACPQVKEAVKAA